MTKNVLKLSDQAVNLMEKRMELNDAGEDDEWSVPIQEAIQESCREARTAEADTEKKGEDETDIELLLEEHDMFLEEMDQEPSRNQENTPREPDDIDARTTISNKLPYQSKSDKHKTQLKKQKILAKLILKIAVLN